MLPLHTRNIGWIDFTIVEVRLVHHKRTYIWIKSISQNSMKKVMFLKKMLMTPRWWSSWLQDFVVFCHFEFIILYWWTRVITTMYRTHCLPPRGRLPKTKSVAPWVGMLLGLFGRGGGGDSETLNIFLWRLWISEWHEWNHIFGRIRQYGTISLLACCILSTLSLKHVGEIRKKALESNSVPGSS